MGTIRTQTHHRWALALVALAAATALTGCSTAYIEKSHGLPDDSDTRFDPTGGPSASWTADGDEFFLTLYGSSSCPPEPKTVTAPDAATIVIEVGTSGGGACTADFGPTTYRIATPDSIDPTASVSVDLGESGQLTLPAVE